MSFSLRRCAIINLLFFLAIIWNVDAQTVAPAPNTNVSAVLTSGYRIYITTTASDHIYGFMYNTDMFDKKLQFGICVTRSLPFCTDTTLGKQTNNSLMVPFGMMSEYNSDIFYDSVSQSLIYIGRDQNTFRRMSLDGPDRSIVFKPGLPLLGGFSVHSKSGLVIYFTKSDGEPMLVDGTPAPTIAKSALPHALWLADPKSTRRPTRLLADLFSCHTLALDERNNVIYLTNYTVGTSSGTYIVETSILVYSLDVSAVVSSRVIDRISSYKFPYTCTQQLTFDAKNQILFSQSITGSWPQQQFFIWGSTVYYSFPSTFFAEVLSIDPKNGVLFQERLGGQIFASNYRREEDGAVAISNQAVLIADFGLTTLRAIVAVPCDETVSCDRNAMSSSGSEFLNILIATLVLVVLGPIVCGFSRFYQPYCT